MPSLPPTITPTRSFSPFLCTFYGVEVFELPLVLPEETQTGQVDGPSHRLDPFRPPI